MLHSVNNISLPEPEPDPRYFDNSGHFSLYYDRIKSESHVISINSAFSQRSWPASHKAYRQGWDDIAFSIGPLPQATAGDAIALYWNNCTIACHYVQENEGPVFILTASRRDISDLLRKENSIDYQWLQQHETLASMKIYHSAVKSVVVK